MDDTIDFSELDEDFSDEASTFGDRIVAAREALGMSSKELARRLGVKAETMDNWENDRSEPRANKLQMLAGVLNVSIIWLMSGKGDAGFDAAAGAVEEDVVADLRKIREIQADLNARLARLERKLLAVPRVIAMEDQAASARLKRLRMRCWRRGTREMDLILGPFADARAHALESDLLDLLEAMLAENDHDLYAWITGRDRAPLAYGKLIGDLRSFHDIC